MLPFGPLLMASLQATILLLSYLILGSLAASSHEIRIASQCFKAKGIPEVTLSCEPNHMIKIHRAFHGIAVRDRAYLKPNKQCTVTPTSTANCSYCEGDCIDDSMNLVYDWSTCMGNRTCTRTVMQSYMPKCSGPDKFSHYLQVEYQCIPRADVINVCSHIEKTVKEAFVMSPNYPNSYPTNQDCICRIYTTNWNSREVLSLYDLLLETKNGRCRADWLMLRQKDQKHRHCGAIMTGTKNLTSETNSIEIQFHSDENDNKTQSFQYFTRRLKGFWLYVTASPHSQMKIACRRLTPNDKEVQEIKADDAEFMEIVTKDKELVTAAPDEEQGVEGKDSSEVLTADEPYDNSIPLSYDPDKKPRKNRPKGKGGPGSKHSLEGEANFNERHKGETAGASTQVLHVVLSLTTIAMATGISLL